MARVHEVSLELVRPGPPHNQLLSPLTPYMALCGGGSPITFHIDFEHRQLLNRLERLRYVTKDGRGGYDAVPDRLREAEVRELGEEMGKVLGRIPSLNAELSRACSGTTRTDESEFVHVRLVLSGSELSVLPFELARAPQSFPGEGLDLCLQGSLPVVVTREIRRNRRLPVSWEVQHPKVLFVFAEPPGLKVPKTEHVGALREALEDWIDWPDPEPEDAQELEGKRLPLVKKRLRVLADASIEAIYEICAAEAFTHVHILAHGDHYEEAGERRFGVALCGHRRPDQKQVVSGEKLAKALRAESDDGVSRSDPLAVTLATCDSGQQGSVLVPGGSIAHDLHAAGIPWVFASQFPLTKRGSVRMARFLYPRLLRGDDPRHVLYELRRYLSMSGSRDHDWASLVTYASLGRDLEREVANFFESQTIKAINVQMARADNLAKRTDDHKSKVPKNNAEAADADAKAKVAKCKAKEALGRVRERLESWERRLPTGELLEARTTRANCFGIKGSTLKRMGLLYAAFDEHGKARDELTTSLDAYHKAMDEWVTEEARFNWTASQYLALSAVLRAEKDQGTYAICRRLAERDLSSKDRGLQAWAHGTLAELDLISLFHEQTAPKEGVKKEIHDQTSLQENVKERILGHCQAIVDLKGLHSFQVHSTRRQFKRYADQWGLKEEPPYHWTKITEIAAEAVKVLDGKKKRPRPND